VEVDVDHFRNTLTLILDILKVFNHILLLWIGIWVHYLSIVRHRHVLAWFPYLGTNDTTMTKSRLGITSDWVHFIIIPIESVKKPSPMVGSHNATTPYHTITPKGVGWVVGFCLGFSLGTCCRIWLGLPIHFILIPDPLHTYIMCFNAFYCG
jgi:hypothetical protein